MKHEVDMSMYSHIVSMLDNSEIIAWSENEFYGKLKMQFRSLGIESGDEIILRDDWRLDINLH